MSQRFLSPFRYPGGKTWLLSHIRRWITCQPTEPKVFVEPFAGGASASLAVASEKLVAHVVMAELDLDVAAVWETIINSKTGSMWLSQKIRKFKVNRRNVEMELRKKNLRGRSLAFQTILRNRVNRGGVLADGAGLLRNGENNNGLRSRWYAQTLHQRLRDITKVRGGIHFEQGDGLEILRREAKNSSAIFFIDPPYTVAGKKVGQRLYKCSEVDHDELFKIVESLSGDFLMTYNDSVVVRRLAAEHGFDVCTVKMRTAHDKTKRELLIGRDLSWCRRVKKSSK